MLRRLFLFVAVATGLLVVAVFALIAFRVALAEVLLSSRLAALGIPSPRLAVKSFDLHGIVVSDIALGSEAELRADTIAVAFRPGALIAGEVDDISIDGLRLRLDLTGAGSPLGSLQPLLEGGNGAAGPAAMPAVVTLSHSRIEAATSSGEATAAVSGRWRPAAGTANLSLSDIVLPQVELETSRFEFAVTSDRIDATATAQSRNESLNVDLSATIESWRGDPTLALDLDGSLAPGTWRISPLPSVGQGTMSVSLHIGGRLQPIKELSGVVGAMDWLRGADLGGLVDASLADVVLRDRAEGISGQSSLAVTVADGSLQVESTDNGRFSIARLNPAWLDATGAGAVVPQLRDAGLTMNLPAGDAPLRVRIAPAAEGVDVTLTGTGDVTMSETVLAFLLDGSLSLDNALSVRHVSFPRADVNLRDLTLAGYRLTQMHLTGTGDGAPDNLQGRATLTAELAATRIESVALGPAGLDLSADFRWSNRRLDIHQRGDGSASLASADFGSAARIARPVGLVLSDGVLMLDLTPQDVAVSHSIIVLPKQVRVEVPRAQAAPLVMQAETGPVRLTGAVRPGEPYRGQISFNRGRLEVPEEAVSAEKVSASVSFAAAPGEQLAQFTVGRIAHVATPAYFAPLQLDGHIDLLEDALELKAAASPAGGGFMVSIGGRHRFADASGSVKIELPRTAFRKGKLQPAQFSPLLRDFGAATGQVGAVAEITWGPLGIAGNGALDLADLSFSTDAVAVEGLDTSIALDGLFPLSTGPDQRLAVRRIDPAVPVEDVAARFRVEPAAAPRLRVNQATGRFAGGRLEVGEVLFDPSQSRHAFTVGVDSIDLGILLGLMNVEGVSGTGRLSGAIPVTIVDESVVVEGGRLVADGPGVLRVRSEAATSALRGAGEQVALMMQALADFRYESLSVTLDVEADGGAGATIRMLGNNPAVLDGYPFAFNIGLSGNATKILAALRQGAQISSDLVRPAVR